jgi:hypothetical protein
MSKNTPDNLLIYAVYILGIIVFPISVTARGVSEQPMTFELVGNGGNCSGCEWISATGIIHSETPMVFLDYIEKNYKNSYVPAITFHSPGGDLLAGVQLGKIIRERGIDTGVGETLPDGDWHRQCSSACVFAFMGGVERIIDKEKDKIGISYFYGKRALADVGALQQAIMGVVAYVKSMGVDTDILFRAAMVPPTKMQWLTPDEIVSFNLDNMNEKTTGWKIEPYNGGIIAQTSIITGPRPPEYMTISCKSASVNKAQLMYSSNTLSSVNIRDIKVAVFDYQIKADESTIKDQALDDTVGIRRTPDGMLYITYDIPMNFMRAIMEAEEVSILLNVPHVYGFVIGRSFPIKGGAPYIEAALKNCTST